MVGRPSLYTPELANEICARIAEGESLRAVCLADDKPAASTVCLWVVDHPEFAERYARAREAQAHLIADEIVEISDDDSGDYDLTPITQDVTAVSKANQENIARSRLRVDTRKWYLSKMLPKRFGDKLEHTGKFEVVQGVSLDL